MPGRTPTSPTRKWFWALPAARRARVRRRLLRALVAVVVLWIGYGVLFGEAGIVRILSLQRKARRLEAEIARLEREAEELKQRRERLQADPAQVEKVAREEYLLARDDELVFRIRKDTK